MCVILGVLPSWVSCCQQEVATTGRPSCQEVQPTGSEWCTAQPIETAHWEKTACHGVCSVFPHRQGMCRAFLPFSKIALLLVLVLNFHICSLHCSSCRFQLLHNDIQSSVFVIEMPERVGTLLDYQLGLLSFYNTQSGQLLGAFRQRFTQPCHPALALELPGRLEVSMVLEAPEFTKDS